MRALGALQQRVRAAGVTANDGFGEAIVEDLVPGTPQNYDFLSERYTVDDAGTQFVSNTDAHLSKLTRGLALLKKRRRDHHALYTLRNVCAFLGLLFWLAHTISVSLAGFADVMRVTQG